MLIRTFSSSSWQAPSPGSFRLEVHGYAKPDPDADPTGSTLVSNNGRPAGGTAALDHDHAQAFTTGANLGGYTLTSVQLKAALPAGNTTLEFDVSVHASTSSGNPGDSLATLTLQGSLPSSAALVEFNAAGGGIDLNPGTTYFVVVDVTAGGTNDGTLERTAASAEDPGGAEGWSIANERFFRADDATTWNSTTNNFLKIAVRGNTTGAPKLTDAAVTNKTLTLTYDAQLDPASVPPTSQFAVSVDDSAVAVSEVDVSGTTVTLTLALSSAVVKDQVVTVSYRGEAGAGINPIRHETTGTKADGFTDRAVTNSTTNRAPVYSGVFPTLTQVAPGNSISALIPKSDFSDVDGDTLTFSTSGSRSELYDSIAYNASPQGERVWVRLKGDCGLRNLEPRVARQNYQHVVTLTAADPAGATVHVDIPFITSLGLDNSPSACPGFSSAAVAGTALTLVFHRAPTGWTPTAEEFEVKVDGSAAALAATNPVSLSGATVTLTLAEPVWAGQTVTLSHTATDDPNTPRDDPKTVGFTDRAVTNDSTNNAPTLSADPDALTGRNLATRTNVFASVVIADPDIAAGDLEIIGPGDTPTNAANALTVTVSAVRERSGGGWVEVALPDPQPNGDVVDPVVESYGYSHFVDRLFVRIRSDAEFCDVADLPNPFETAVTVTAVDSGGATASLTLAGITAWDSSPCRPPAVSDAAVDGSTLTVTFNEELHQGSVPAGSAFTVRATPAGGTARTISGTGTATISGMTATVALDGAVVQGETLTVSYTAPDANPILDLDGEAAPDFSSLAATNDTPSDTTSPTFSRATVNGRTLTLTVSEFLDTGSAPAGSAFTVSATPEGSTTPRTISGTGTATISGRTATVPLNGAVVHGETVTVSYTAPGSNPLQDLSGNDLADFTGKAVTNHSPETTKPTLRGAGIAPSDRTKLRLVFDEPLKEDAVPYPAAFSVRSGFSMLPLVGNPVVKGNVVTLTLTSQVATNASVTVSYLKLTPGARALQDLAGNEVDSFAAQTVKANNRAPTRGTNAQNLSINAPPGTWVSLEVDQTAVHRSRRRHADVHLDVEPQRRAHHL